MVREARALGLVVVSGAVLRDADFSQKPAAEPFAELARRNRSVGVSGRRVAFVRKLFGGKDKDGRQNTVQ